MLSGGHEATTQSVVYSYCFIIIASTETTRHEYTQEKNEERRPRKRLTLAGCLIYH
ncbi:hypothetical protein OIU77_010410 [Salix suchowensis]|uniref:Uncharacterized protein n=1 Tax=Salix suchowensis TaxID=1278906 RepID=A0ABQ9A889_9ROSI|nr:hypothetical protein OIU77_010410 [Salix suchowensis]